jgi:hypothetical protein
MIGFADVDPSVAEIVVMAPAGIRLFADHALALLHHLLRIAGASRTSGRQAASRSWRLLEGLMTASSP